MGESQAGGGGVSHLKQNLSLNREALSKCLGFRTPRLLLICLIWIQTTLLSPNTTIDRTSLSHQPRVSSPFLPSGEGRREEAKKEQLGPHYCSRSRQPQIANNLLLFLVIWIGSVLATRTPATSFLRQTVQVEKKRGEDISYFLPQRSRGMFCNHPLYVAAEGQTLLRCTFT